MKKCIRKMTASTLALGMMLTLGVTATTPTSVAAAKPTLAKKSVVLEPNDTKTVKIKGVKASKVKSLKISSDNKKIVKATAAGTKKKTAIKLTSSKKTGSAKVTATVKVGNKTTKLKIAVKVTADRQDLLTVLQNNGFSEWDEPSDGVKYITDYAITAFYKKDGKEEKQGDLFYNVNDKCLITRVYKTEYNKELEDLIENTAAVDIKNKSLYGYRKLTGDKTEIDRYITAPDVVGSEGNCAEFDLRRYASAALNSDMGYCISMSENLVPADPSKVKKTVKDGLIQYNYSFGDNNITINVFSEGDLLSGRIANITHYNSKDKEQMRYEFHYGIDPKVSQEDAQSLVLPDEYKLTLDSAVKEKVFGTERKFKIDYKLYTTVYDSDPKKEGSYTFETGKDVKVYYASKIGAFLYLTDKDGKKHVFEDMNDNDIFALINPTEIPAEPINLYWEDIYAHTS